LNSVVDIYTHTILNLAISIQLFAIILFLNSAIHKVRDYRDFVSILAGYKLVPLSAVWVLGGIVLVAEFLAVLGLLLTVPFLKYLAALLLIGYAIAIQVNVARGRTELDCGCGGQSQPISQALVIRNVAIAILLVWSTNIAGFVDIIGIGVTYWALIIGIVISLGSLYLSYNQLCLNQSLLNNLMRKTS
jgi:hypothetical protein